MIANYGYEDGSGFYYITIDGDRCLDCTAHPCVDSCSENVYLVEMDDYDDLVATVEESKRRRLRELCAHCKAANLRTERAAPAPPCVRACPSGAIVHSW